MRTTSGAAKLGVAILLGCLGTFGLALTAAVDLPPAADPKLQATYLRLRFDRMYPAEAVALIGETVKDAERAVESLVPLAKHPNHEVRVLVALLLGELGDKDGANALWDLLVDESEPVRLTASGALIRMRNQTPVAARTDGLADPRWETRRLVAATLKAMADKTAEAALLDALRDDHPLVRTDVVLALSSAACGTDNALPSLIEMLQDSSVNVRDRTAYVLGHFHNVVVIPPLEAALNDPDWHVRAAAAHSLKGWVKDQPSVIRPLVQTLRTDEFALVRDRAADALAFAQDELAIESLVASVISDNRDARLHAARALIRAEAVSAVPMLVKHRDHPNPDVRLKIVEIVGALGGETEIPVLTAGLDDPDATVRLTSVQALRSLQTRTTTNIDFEGRLRDLNPHVRAASARTVGQLRRTEAVPQLITLLRDPSSYVRGAAAEALGMLGDQTAVQPLITVLAGEQVVPGTPDDGLILGTDVNLLPELARLKRIEEQIEAVRALAELRSPDSVDPIIEHGLGAPDAGLRAESAVALGKIGEQRATGPLQDAVRPYYQAAATVEEMEAGNIIASQVIPDSVRQMKEREARVRASVAWALGELGDPATIPTLSQATNDENSLVRDAALEALAKVAEKQERLLAQRPPPALAD